MSQVTKSMKKSNLKNDIGNKPKIGKTKLKKQLTIVGFLLVPLTLLLIFTYMPVINMLGYSFTSWNGFSPDKIFIGFENYISIFTNPEYFKVFKTSLYYFVGAFIQLIIALYFATILTSKIKGSNFFKGVIFFPYLLNGVAIGFVFLFFFTPDGVLDTILELIGLGHIDILWLGNPDVVNYSLAGVSIWRYMGFNMLIFIGAIQSIPEEIYEAAALDGANRWQQFRYIILPSIRRIVELNLLLAINGALSVFDIPYIMTGGGNGSSTFVIQTVDTAFKYNKVGMASAMAIVLLIIVLIVTGIQRRYLNDKEEA